MTERIRGSFHGDGEDKDALETLVGASELAEREAGVGRGNARCDRR